MAKLKADAARWLDVVMQTKIRKMVRGIQNTSKTVETYTEFTSSADMLAHFDTTFDDWMTPANYGYGDGKWHVGHRIAKAMYNPHIERDVRSCWAKANLFAQEQKENMELSVTLPSDEVLLSVRQYWPVAWNDQLPTVEQRHVYEAAARKGGNKD